MRLKISPPYGFKPTDEQLVALQRHDPNVRTYPTDDPYEWQRGTVKGTLFVEPADLYQDPELRGIEFRMDGGQVDMSNLLTILGEVQQALNRVAGMSIPATRDAREQLFNERVQVHVPGLGLLILDEVKVLYDQCTDGLQEHLDDGWRILAVCPQPDKRRPDYVLGRKK